eukprot:6636043-Alexandrium_andersonii.AAC.1
MSSSVLKKPAAKPAIDTDNKATKLTKKQLEKQQAEVPAMSFEDCRLKLEFEIALKLANADSGVEWTCSPKAA